MGIRIENTTYGAAPVIICDYCGTRIHAARDGNDEWAGQSTEPGTRMQVYFLRKWGSPAHEAQRGIILDSMELAVMLPQLGKGIQLVGEEALQHTEMPGEQ
jgi:hypothetical protein